MKPVQKAWRPRGLSRALSLGLAVVAAVSGCPARHGQSDGDAVAGHHTIAHWKFDGPVGATVADLRGPHPGRARGAFRTGEAAWVFPGDTSCVRVAHEAALDLATGFTIEAVLRPARLGNPANGEGFQAIVEKHAAPGGYLLVLRPTGKLEYWLETADGRTVDSSAVAIELNTGWHHVAMTWDGASIGLYVDGAPAGERPFSGPLGRCSQDLFLGNDDNVWWGFGGEIREIRVSGRALSPRAFLTVQ